MAPSAKMLESAAYKRMRDENPSEFVPRSVFFTHKDREIDLGNSFWVKAALVYESITGEHVNDKTKPVAYKLLLSLAKACCSGIHDKKSDVPATSPPSPSPASAPVLASPSPASAPVLASPSSPPLQREAETGPGRSANPKTQEAEKMVLEEGLTPPEMVPGEELHVVPSPENLFPKATDDPATSPPSPSRPSPREAETDPGRNSANPKTQEGEKTTQLPNEKQVIDGIFLVVGFLSRLREASRINSRDAVDESFKSMHMQNIVTDVIKLENQQLPLKHLLEVVKHVEAAVNNTLSAEEFKGLIKNKDKKYELGFKHENFHEVIHCFCWYYSPFFHKKAAEQQIVDGDHTLLDCLHASLVPRLLAGAGARGNTSSMPTARELTRSGVRFDAVEDGRAVVDFQERSSRLSLPALVYDFKLATVARNLLALEYEEQSKPVTRYFQMMNELVEEVADVRILRRARVVRGGSRGAHEVHELIKKIDGYATYPSVFMAMDQQIEKVKQFHDKRMKKFLVRYRPGVIWASSVAAVSVVAIIAARKKRA